MNKIKLASDKAVSSLRKGIVTKEPGIPIWIKPTHCSSPDKAKWNRAVCTGIRRVLLVVTFKPDMPLWYPLDEEPRNQLVSVNADDSLANVLPRIVGALRYNDVASPNAVHVHRYVFSEKDVIGRNRRLHGGTAAYNQVPAELDNTVGDGNALDKESGSTRTSRQHTT